MVTTQVTPQTYDAAATTARKADTKVQLEMLLTYVVDAMTGPRAAKFAGTTYANDVWSGANAVDQCWRCTFGPAVATAALAGRTGSPAYTTIALRTFDAALVHQQPNGAFVEPQTSQSTAVDTMYFATELGLAYQSLLPRLGAERRARWSGALTLAAAYLVNSKATSTWTTGHLALGNVVAMAAAWKATGNPTYEAYMNTALAFAVDPPQRTWPGDGLIYSRTPQKADGSDGSGYFAEAGEPGPSYDPQNTEIQADNATSLYLLTGDPRALRLMNLLVNQLLIRTNTTTWHLNTGGGSAHPGSGQWQYLTTAALDVLVWRGGRTDLARYVAPQLTAIVANFSSEAHFLLPATWSAFGSQPVGAYLAATG